MVQLKDLIKRNDLIYFKSVKLILLRAQSMRNQVFKFNPDPNDDNGILRGQLEFIQANYAKSRAKLNKLRV